jgi:hypothetical protein
MYHLGITSVSPGYREDSKREVHVVNAPGLVDTYTILG